MLLQRSFAAGGIAVDTRDRHLREQRRRGLLQLLGADPYRHQMRGAAGRTLARDWALAVAMVAAQMVLRTVQRIVTVAARAFRYPAAIVAQQRWRKARRLETGSLVIRLQVLAHTANQRGRQARLQRLPFEDRARAAGPGAHCPRVCLRLTGGIYHGGRYAESPAPASPSRELSGSARCGRAIPPCRGHGSASLPAACRSCHALRR